MLHLAIFFSNLCFIMAGIIAIGLIFIPWDKISIYKEKERYK